MVQKCCFTAATHCLSTVIETECLFIAHHGCLLEGMPALDRRQQLGFALKEGRFKGQGAVGGSAAARPIGRGRLETHAGGGTRRAWRLPHSVCARRWGRAWLMLKAVSSLQFGSCKRVQGSLTGRPLDPL